MRSFTPRTLALLGLVAACSPDRPAPDTASMAFASRLPNLALSTHRVELSNPDSAACDEVSWLSYTEATRSCSDGPPSSAGYLRGEPLFDLPAPGSNDPFAALRGYCRHTWVPGTSATPPSSAFTFEPSARFERECYVAGSQGNQAQLTAADVTAMEAAFDHQLNAPRWPSQTQLTGRVRLAVLDDSTQGGLTSLTTPHGAAMANLIRRLACPDAAHCAATIKSYLALPVRAGQRQSSVGRYGNGADVARSLVQALRDFEVSPAGDTRLVVNMSLGWRREDLWTPIPDPRTGRRMVIPRLTDRAAAAAVELLASRGVLLIAAAGNQGASNNLLDDPVPLYPAAWEAMRKPGGIGYEPMVHAIGAVDGRDQPLEVMRAQALPRLVAPGAFGVAETQVVLVPRPGLGWTLETQLRGGFSGTSVAAAAASAVAATVWSLRPDLSASQVMSTVYLAGARLPTSVRPDFWLQGELQPYVRRISACHAIVNACRYGGASCPGASQLPVCPALRPAGQDATWNLRAASLSGFSGISAQLRWPSPYEPDYLPGEEDVPYAGGQPGTRTCPLCLLTDDGIFMGKLDAQAGDRVTLVLYVAGSEEPLKLAMDELAGAGAFKRDLNLGGTPKKAAVYVERDGVSYGSEVLVGSDDSYIFYGGW